MVKINWTDQAISDLINIAEFIRKDSDKYAILTVKKIRERVKQLKDFPMSGKVVPEYENTEIRELVLGNYRIIYQFHSEYNIDILTLHHSARNLEP